MDHPLEMVIPGIPPKFEPGAAFGAFTFGTVPPPPPGFPPFPLPPSIAGSGFGFAPPPGSLPPGTPPPGGLPPEPMPIIDPSAPGMPIGAPPGLPPGLPEQFYAFHDALTAMHEFLQSGALPPPGGPLGDGTDGLPPGIQFQFLDFESIAEFLPPSFLSPEAVAGAFDSFGEGHPLIGEGAEVNPELEEALFEHPPVPEGFDGFDFTGDTPQFDDLLTVYNPATVGTTLTGQVNSTFSGVLDDGGLLKCVDTTVLEVIPGQAAPLVQMEPGVYQTQWVVDTHQQTSSHFVIENPEDPEHPLEFDVSKEVYSQVTWTMLIKEVDTDGDGVVDEVQTTGANTIEVIEENVDGEMPTNMPPLPEPPALLMPMQFQGVMAVTKPDESAEDDSTSDEPLSSGADGQ